MGSIVGKAMSESMEKQQTFMVQNQAIMLERQIQMNNLMREKQMSMQLARAREMFNWWASFYGIYIVAAILGAKKNKGVLVPFLPLTFIVGYQFDLAHGNKMDRIREEADRILEKESGLLNLPQGVPSLATVEARRLKQKDEERTTSTLSQFT